MYIYIRTITKQMIISVVLVIITHYLVLTYTAYNFLLRRSEL